MDTTVAYVLASATMRLSVARHHDVRMIPCKNRDAGSRTRLDAGTGLGLRLGGTSNKDDGNGQQEGIAASV